jgi:capsular exopolysaccharide synthesis family protein
LATVQPYGGSAVLQVAPPNESRLLLGYLRILFGSKGLLLLVACAGLLAGLAVSYLQTPVFRASATVEIQGLNGEYLNLKAFDPTTVFQEFSPEGEILTQAKIMEREALLDLVSAGVRSRSAQKSAVWESALDYASGHVDVRLIPGTHIVELLCDSTDKRVAADFANVWAEEYIKENRESRVRTTQQTENSLRTQLEEVKTRLEKSEEELVAYARKINLMLTGEEQSSVAEEKLRQTQTALSTAETERIAKQSEYELISAASPESMPQFLDDPAGHEQQGKLDELKSQLDELRTYMAPGHAKVVRQEAQIKGLEAAVRNRREQVAKRVRNDFESARRRESLLRLNYDAQAQVVTEQAQKAIRYKILKRDAETNRTLYESLLQKVKEAGVAKAMRAGNVRLVDAAKAPFFPYKPRVLANAVMGLMAGLFLGIAFITVRERADHNIRVPGESPACLRIPELGAIPSAEAGRSQTPLLIESSRNRGIVVSTSGDTRTDAQLASPTGVLPVLADSFRAILASLLFSPQNDISCVGIVIASAGPGDGKSTIVCNLGLAMAETDRRVLLIDGDLRSPRLHEIFDVPNRGGLTELLQVEDPSPEVMASRLVRVAANSGLYILPAGNAPGQISHLLYSARLPKLLQRFREEFDAILIDSPPMLQTPDARILARVAGAAVLVIRAGQTSRDTAAAAAQRFAEDGTPVLGTILNDWNLKAASGSANRKYKSRNERARG